MYMRYAGGGVGHYPVRIDDSPADSAILEDNRDDEEMLPQAQTTFGEEAASGSDGEDAESDGSDSGSGESSEEDAEDVLGNAEGEFVLDEGEMYE